MDEDLKPCPFCAGSASVNYVPFSRMYGEYRVICKQCGVMTEASTDKQEAMKMWNRRVDNGTILPVAPVHRE